MPHTPKPEPHPLENTFKVPKSNVVHARRMVSAAVELITEAAGALAGQPGLSEHDGRIALATARSLTAGASLLAAVSDSLRAQAELLTAFAPRPVLLRHADADNREAPDGRPAVQPRPVLDLNSPRLTPGVRSLAAALGLGPGARFCGAHLRPVGSGSDLCPECVAELSEVP